MKYQAAYRCPMCNELIKSNKSMEIPYNQLPDLLAKVVKNQMFMSNPALYQFPMQIPHQCSNGSAGLATFAGFISDI